MARRLWIVGRIGIVLEHLSDDGTSDQRLQLSLLAHPLYPSRKPSPNVNSNWNFRSSVVMASAFVFPKDLQLRAWYLLCKPCD
jgi:hypothetical protein